MMFKNTIRSLLLTAACLLLLAGSVAAAEDPGFSTLPPPCPGTLVVGDCDTRLPARDMTGQCLQGLVDECVRSAGDRLDLSLCLHDLEPWLSGEAMPTLDECAWTASEASLAPPPGQGECRGRLGPTRVVGMPFNVRVCASRAQIAKKESRRILNEMVRKDAEAACLILGCDQLQCEEKNNRARKCKTKVHTKAGKLGNHICRDTRRVCDQGPELPPGTEWICTGLKNYVFTCMCQCEFTQRGGR